MNTTEPAPYATAVGWAPDGDNAAALQAIYLACGAEDYMREYPTAYDLEPLGGHIGLMEMLADFGGAVRDYITSNTDESTPYPGVFEYEVTEPLGRWVIANLSEPFLKVLFMAELDRRFRLFMEQ